MRNWKRDSASESVAGVRREQQMRRGTRCAFHWDEPVKAAAPTSVTSVSIAFDCDAQPEDVLITVGAHFDNIKHVAAFGALLPQCGAGATPEVGDDRLDGAEGHLRLPAGDD